MELESLTFLIVPAVLSFLAFEIFLSINESSLAILSLVWVFKDSRYDFDKSILFEISFMVLRRSIFLFFEDLSIISSFGSSDKDEKDRERCFEGLYLSIFIKIVIDYQIYLLFKY